jgi:putative transposase
MSRLGAKGVYSDLRPDSGSVSWLAGTTARLQVVEVDSTQLDEFVELGIGDHLAKPWLTIAVDVHTHAIVGVYITLLRPSQASILSLLLDIVIRHGKLPAEIHVDNGKEHRNTRIEMLLARYGVNLVYAPPHSPRYRPVVEAAFKKINTGLVHALAGNTKALKDVRSMSKEVDPRQRCAWTYAAFAEQLETYLFSIFPEQHVASLGTTPRMLWSRAKDSAGARVIKVGGVRYDFLPDVKHNKLTYSAEKGIRHDGRSYLPPNEDLIDSIGRKVSVRYDPADDSYIYVLVDDKWMRWSIANPSPLQQTAMEVKIGSDTRRYLFRRQHQLAEEGELKHGEFLLKTKEAELKHANAKPGQQTTDIVTGKRALARGGIRKLDLSHEN